jgi:hypothetical protein
VQCGKCVLWCACVFVVCGMCEFLHMLGKCSSTKPCSQPPVSDSLLTNRIKQNQWDVMSTMKL